MFIKCYMIFWSVYEYYEILWVSFCFPGFLICCPTRRILRWSLSRSNGLTLKHKVTIEHGDIGRYHEHPVMILMLDYHHFQVISDDRDIFDISR